MMSSEITVAVIGAGGAVLAGITGYFGALLGARGTVKAAILPLRQSAFENALHPALDGVEGLLRDIHRERVAWRTSRTEEEPHEESAPPIDLDEVLAPLYALLRVAPPGVDRALSTLISALTRLAQIYAPWWNGEREMKGLRRVALAARFYATEAVDAYTQLTSWCRSRIDDPHDFEHHDPPDPSELEGLEVTCRQAQGRDDWVVVVEPLETMRIAEQYITSQRDFNEAISQVNEARDRLERKSRTWLHHG
ncbi:hypothetical protein AB0O20_34940 [Streptomyces kronopolitis]|uniref:hypothetical protein n=1 Tax=Streptomyces kronopolitis TaxID=1612435 RepID=UPI0034258572